MTDTILLTGGTGFLGTLLTARLCQNPEVKTYVLVRAADEEEPEAQNAPPERPRRRVQAGN